MDVVLGTSFLILSNVDVLFAERELIRRSYISVKALLIIKRVQMIDRKKFTAVALDLDKKIFVIYIAYLESKMLIYLAQKAQIIFLSIEKLPKSVPAKYADYANVFSKKSAAKLPECFDINEYSINLESSK